MPSIDMATFDAVKMVERVIICTCLYNDIWFSMRVSLRVAIYTAYILPINNDVFISSFITLIN